MDCFTMTNALYKGVSVGLEWLLCFQSLPDYLDGFFIPMRGSTLPTHMKVLHSVREITDRLFTIYVIHL